MSRQLQVAALAGALALSSMAAAAEPLWLADTDLDQVTAAAATAAGWEVLTFANGQRYLPGPFVVAGGTFSQQVATGVPGNSTNVDVEGVAGTRSTPFSSYTLARYNGTVTTEGDGIGRIDPASTATGDYTGSGGVTIPVANADGSTSYIGYSWAWAYDVPTFTPN